MMDCRTVLRRSRSEGPCRSKVYSDTCSFYWPVPHSIMCCVGPACLLLAPVPPAAAAGVAQLHSVTQRKDEPSVTLSVPLLFIHNPGRSPPACTRNLATGIARICPRLLSFVKHFADAVLHFATWSHETRHSSHGTARGMAIR